MIISQFLLDVAEHGFTRACDKHEIKSSMLKEMCAKIIETEPNTITPFSTKQQIVYRYISIMLKQHGL